MRGKKRCCLKTNRRGLRRGSRPKILTVSGEKIPQIPHNLLFFLRKYLQFSLTKLIFTGAYILDKNWPRSSQIHFSAQFLPTEVGDELKATIFSKINIRERSESCESLNDNVPWYFKQLKSTAWLGPVSLTQHGVKFQPVEVSDYPYISQTMDVINEFCLKQRLIQDPYNACLIQYCRDGTHSLRFDANEVFEGQSFTLLSLGSKRRIEFRRGKKVGGAVVAQHGSILTCGENFAKCYGCLLPQSKRVKGDLLCVTFRRCAPPVQKYSTTPQSLPSLAE